MFRFMCQVEQWTFDSFLFFILRSAPTLGDGCPFEKQVFNSISELSRLLVAPWRIPKSVEIVVLWRKQGKKKGNNGYHYNGLIVVDIQYANA